MKTMLLPITAPSPPQAFSALRILVDLEHTIFRCNNEQQTLQIAHIEALVGAHEGVARLSQLGHLSYCTQDETTDRFTRQRRRATITQWLCDHGFPHHEEVLFSVTPGHTLEVIYEAYTSQGISVWLIDDQIEGFLLEVARRSLRQPHILKSFRKYLHLVAFGKYHAPALNFGIPSFALSSWAELQQLLSQRFSSTASEARASPMLGEEKRPKKPQGLDP
jgi:hypothetical protein